jgi:3'-5' exoribonuclease
MPPVVDLKRLAVGERVQDPLLVWDVENRGSGETLFTVLTLGNCTGRIESAPFWNEAQAQIAGVSRGDVVQVIGEVGLYRDKRQLKVGSIRVLPKTGIDWRQLLPSIEDPAPYWDTLDRWRAEIRRPRLARVLSLFFDDPDFRDRFELCPAATVGHHAELGGLLRHVTEVASIARTIARVCRADQELVLAGALLHDIGKLESYTWDGAFGTTECGALLGHVALGVLMLERRIREETPSPCTDQELMILEHLILSHHGKLEFGAAVPPMTLEAEVLHYADNASAKTESMRDALRDPENFPDGGLLSARGIWTLDRRKAWRGSSDWGEHAGGLRLVEDG